VVAFRAFPVTLPYDLSPLLSFLDGAFDFLAALALFGAAVLFRSFPTTLVDLLLFANSMVFFSPFISRQTHWQIGLGHSLLF